MNVPPLFRRLPELEGRLPWVSLGARSTPVEALPDMGDCAAWIKRDDLSSPDYGGNKVRKLEFLLAEARSRRAERLVTAGAEGSHHVLATAFYGARLGLPTTAVLFPQPPTPHALEAARTVRALAAEVRMVGRMEALPLGVWMARRAHRRRRVTVVAPGGSDPLGTLAYTSAAIELAGQVERGELPEPVELVVAAGTMGTAAGLALGLELSGLSTRIIAVRVASRLVTNTWRVRRLLRGAAGLVAATGAEAPDPERAVSRIDLVHRRVGSGYGHPTQAGEEAADRFREAGLELDPIYTGKAAAEFLSRAESDPGRPRLFWHTLSRVHPARPSS